MKWRGEMISAVEGSIKLIKEKLIEMVGVEIIRLSRF